MKHIFFFFLFVGSLNAQTLTIQKPAEPILKIRSNSPQTVIVENGEVYVTDSCIEIVYLKADLSVNKLTYTGSFTTETIFEDMDQQVFLRFFSNRMEIRNFQGKRLYTFYPKYYVTN